MEPQKLALKFTLSILLRKICEFHKIAVNFGEPVNQLFLEYLIEFKSEKMHIARNLLILLLGSNKFPLLHFIHGVTLLSNCPAPSHKLLCEGCEFATLEYGVVRCCMMCSSTVGREHKAFGLARTWNFTCDKMLFPRPLINKSLDQDRLPTQAERLSDLPHRSQSPMQSS